ncbi:MAG: GTP cyclohydrolase II [Geminicoccaceae bacterium]|jgi:GTP cyclohydrolase II|nr:GTP cyclohydrolase II [Geminicoccaceae bacterium]
MSEIFQPDMQDFIKVAAADRFLRGGMACRVIDAAGRVTVKALESMDDASLGTQLAGGAATLLLSARRAAALGIRPAGPDAVRIALPAGTAVEQVRALVDPTRLMAALAETPASPASPADVAAIELCKIANLLPACVVVAGTEPAALELDAATVMAYRTAAAGSFERITEARVPLADAADARFVAFRSRLGGPQHYAILVGRPEAFAAPLCRLHSECFTGDLFGSLRCDCGEQLKGAIRRMDEAGGGVLLYLAQEGRGIGLVNKLRAYTLQDSGVDTVDANTHLGFEPDERDFIAAATMLRDLGFSAVRLLTNNPDKVTQLAERGIQVTERVEHSFAANRHNRFYLETKASRSGHLLRLPDLPRRGAA